MFTSRAIRQRYMYWVCRMAALEGSPTCKPPAAKKSKLEEEPRTDGGKLQQLVKRSWIKIEQSKESQDHKLLKVMQWNSLADGLAHSSFIRCPVEALKWTYRAPLILQEILRSGADVVCMEEVDHFHDFLQPQLEQKGFKGLFVEKRNSPCLEYTPNNGPDGCALFYRTSKLTLLKKKELVLNREDGTKSNQVSMMVELQLSLGNSESSEDSVSASKVDNTNVPSQEQKSENTQLEEPAATSSPAVSTQTICVAVTHLKAKREGRDLRLAQGKHLLSEIESFAKNHPVIVCGDFNATADEPVYKLFSGGDLPLNLFSSYVTPQYGGKEPPLTSWKFRAAGESKYTIDYIWFTPNTLKVDSIWTVPTEEEIGKDGLPCTKYPSDHVSICTCFRLKIN